MRWPWVSRRQYDEVMANALRLANIVDSLQATSQHYERALAITRGLMREEQWRRIKAEGLCAYKDERIRRVLGLPIWPAEEKKAG